MKTEYLGYIRFCMASSTIFLSLAVTSITWLASMLVLYYLSLIDVVSFKGEQSMWISSAISFVVICLMLVYLWHFKGSRKLQVLEITAGVILIIIGAGYFDAGLRYDGGKFLGELFYFLLGIYLAANGVLFAIASGLGWLSLRLAVKWR